MNRLASGGRGTGVRSWLWKPENVSAANHHDRPLSTGTQEHTEYPELYPLTKPIIKRAAISALSLRRKSSRSCLNIVHRLTPA